MLVLHFHLILKEWHKHHPAIKPGPWSSSSTWQINRRNHKATIFKLLVPSTGHFHELTSAQSQEDSNLSSPLPPNLNDSILHQVVHGKNVSCQTKLWFSTWQSFYVDTCMIGHTPPRRQGKECTSMNMIRFQRNHFLRLLKWIKLENWGSTVVSSTQLLNLLGQFWI